VKKTLIAIVVFTAIALCSSCNRGGANTLPRELEGAWVTDDPQYTDRLIKFWSSEYVILTGAQGQANPVQSVDKVERQQYGNGFTLTIYSKNRAGDSNQMGLTYTPANGGEVRFRNQKQVWKRVPER
jgi:hypothetical protein